MYAKYIKRFMDFFCSLIAIIVLSPVMAVTALLVKIKLGSPVVFMQERPGKDEKIFKMYKFRSMTDERDERGELLPDDIRLTKFGKALRKTSLDELPELFNILKGDMSIVGPRPLLVRDMVFMTQQQRKRHTVRPGLSGLAQVNGRNVVSWEKKLELDLDYISNITFFSDWKIIVMTIWKAFIKHENIEAEGMATAEDLGDYLKRIGIVSEDVYNQKQSEAINILNK